VCQQRVSYITVILSIVIASVFNLQQLIITATLQQQMMSSSNRHHLPRLLRFYGQSLTFQEENGRKKKRKTPHITILGFQISRAVSRV